MSRKRILSILLILILITSLALSVFAEGGNGDGSGGGKNVPLGLAESSIPDGSTNIPTNVTITLTFNKNVVNFTVKDNNMTCFSLSDSRGNNVPVSVLMGDDQVDPDIKRIVNIKPSSLSEGETYALTISGRLTAKSGAVLGNDIILHFSTVAPAATPTPSVKPSPSVTPTPPVTAGPAATVTASPSQTVSASPSASPSPSAKAEKKGKAKGTAKIKEKEKKSSSLVMEDTDDGEDVTPSRTHNQPIAVYVILGLILLGVLVYFLISRKNNKKNPQ